MEKPQANKSQNSSNFSSYLSPIEKYRLEWSDLSTVCEDSRLVRLRQIACAGSLKVAKFRSICWAVLLDVLRGDQNDWLQQRRVHRAMYQHIKTKWHTNPHCVPTTTSPSASDCGKSTSKTTSTATTIADDPLSQDQESAWNQHFCDQELYAVIRQDVVRTFPGVDFYRRDNIQTLMVDVLFCYAREQPAMCYRQGMHEILAPVLFVLHCDQQTMLHIVDTLHKRTQSGVETEQMDDALVEILDPKFMEEDAYFIFIKIMSSIESFYHIRDMTPMASGHFPVQQSTNRPQRGHDSHSALEVVGQLNYIRDRILANVDVQLHKHLQTLDIPLTLFGIRWLRLLFGREFSLPDLLVLWEAIFAHGKGFSLTNYVVVAMLVLIRQQLLDGDYTTCLTHLMKYPSNVDISLVIRYAMHIKAPQLYECPTVTFLPKSLSLSRPTISTTVRQQSQMGPRRRTVSHEEQVTSTAERRFSTNGRSTASDEQKNEHLRTIQKTTAQTADQITAYSQAMHRGEQDASIVEGFRENSPEALRIELESAKAVMSITRFKLTQYLAVLRSQIRTNDAVDNVHQAMDGIEELCSLLEIKPSSDYGRTLPVERAFEAANDPAVQITTPNNLQQIRKLSETSEITVKPSMNGNQSSNRTIVTVSPDSASEATPNSGGSSIDTDPQQQQRRRLSSGASSYEIPVDDRRISRKAFRILGNRKEVELREFRSPTFEHNTDVQRDAVSPLPEADPPGERQSPEQY